MRILDDITEKPLSNVTVLLTYNEARELRGRLDELIQTNDGESHCHISDNDYQHEVTIALYDEINISAFNKRVQQLILNDK